MRVCCLVLAACCLLGGCCTHDVLYKDGVTAEAAVREYDEVSAEVIRQAPVFHTTRQAIRVEFRVMEGRGYKKVNVCDLPDGYGTSKKYSWIAGLDGD